MKRTFSLTLGLVVWMSMAAFADRIYLQPNDGSGENFAYVGSMNRHIFVITGGADRDFFNTNGYDPGSTLQLSGELFLFDSSIWVNGAFRDFSFPSAFIDMKITLPSNGRSFFRAFVTVHFSADGIDSASGQTVSVDASSTGWIPFYLGSDGLYRPDFFQATPEPSTWALMGTGFIAILAMARKRLRAS